MSRFGSNLMGRYALRNLVWRPLTFVVATGLLAGSMGLGVFLFSLFDWTLKSRSIPVLSTFSGGGKGSIWIAGACLAVSLLILSIACVEAGRLIQVQCQERQRETAVQRALGATTSALRKATLWECAVLCGSAFVPAILMAGEAQLLFNAFGSSRFDLESPILSMHGGVMIMALITVACAVLLAGWALRRKQNADQFSLVLNRGVTRKGASFASLNLAVGLAVMLLFCACISQIVLYRAGGWFGQVPSQTLIGYFPANNPDPDFYPVLLEQLKENESVEQVAIWQELGRQNVTINSVKVGPERVVAISGSMSSLNLRLERGRGLPLSGDETQAALIDSRLATHAGDPFHQNLRLEDGAIFEIVGVTNGEWNRPAFYIPFTGRSCGPTRVFLRYSGLQDNARSLLSQFGPVWIEDGMDRVKARDSLMALARTLSAIAGFLALMLTAVGVHTRALARVQAELREIWVRRAMGATQSFETKIMVQKNLVKIWPGLLGGAGLSIGISLLINRVYPVEWTAMALCAATVCVLITVVLLFAAMNPMTRALRSERRGSWNHPHWSKL